MGRVLVTRRLPEGGTDPLTAAGHEVIENSDDVAMTRDELAARASEVDGILCVLSDPIDAAVLEAGAGGRLRLVSTVAVGFDNIDVGAAQRLGVTVCNTPGILDETTADLAFSLILAASRLTSDAERFVRNGSWTGWGVTQFLGHDVFGATLGIVGYGRIGRAVARRAEGFSMTVLHYARNDTGIPGHVASLDELLERSDVVSLHVPLSDSTRHLIGARELALLGPRGVLVNTARGPVVDEEALADALHSGTIFAAGLDVYENEPAIHPRLLTAPRVVLLPHIGSASQATRTRMARIASTAVCDVLAGKEPEFPVRA